MKKHITYLIVLLIIGCDSNLKKWMTYDEKQEIEENSNSKIKKLQYKRIQSISTDKNELIKGYEKEINLCNFTAKLQYPNNRRENSK